MEITLNTGMATFDPPKALARPRAQGFDGLVARSIDEQEEEARKGETATPGIGMPGAVSEQERQEMELLRNKAMQIASQAEGDLTPGQEAEIKSIQHRINELGGMPMSENLTQAAKETAKQNQFQKRMENAEPEPTDMAVGEFQTLDGEDGALNPGLQMLQRNALVTSIKSAGSQGMGMGFRSKS